MGTLRATHHDYGLLGQLEGLDERLGHCAGLLLQLRLFGDALALLVKLRLTLALGLVPSLVRLTQPGRE